MSNPSANKPTVRTTNRLNELISWRLIKKNPAGGLIWGIYGASLIINSYFWIHFLKHKEYQVTIKHGVCQLLSNINTNLKIGQSQKTHVE